MTTLSRQASRTLFISSLVFLIGVGAAGWMWSSVTELSNTYHEQLQLAANVAERESASQQLYTLVAETADERAAIESYFLDVVEIASFLEQVEQYAANNGLLLESDRLQELPLEDDERIVQVQIPYSVEGTRTDVLQFVELLETVPYHGHMQRMELETLGHDEGRVFASEVIRLSYMQYDRE